MFFSLFAFFGMPGHLELLILALIILLFFGNRLPGVMRSIGTGIVEFKKGVSGIEDEGSSASKEEKEEEKDAGE